MKALFEPLAAADMVERIEKLQPDSQPIWGKMNVAQMLSHAQVPIEVALGDKKLKQTFMGMLFGKVSKHKLFNEKPFVQGLPTDRSFIRKGEHDFETEKQRLLNLVSRVVSASPDGFTKDPHPFFGRLTLNEWGTSLWKHLDHHLRQFGV